MHPLSLYVESIERLTSRHKQTIALAATKAQVGTHFRLQDLANTIAIRGRIGKTTGMFAPTSWPPASAGGGRAAGALWTSGCRGVRRRPRRGVPVREPWTAGGARGGAGRALAMTHDVRAHRLLRDGGKDPERAPAAPGKGTRPGATARCPPPTPWRKTRGHL
jgi:hypothetical protein